MSVPRISDSLLPCPCCKGKAKPVSNLDHKRQIVCSNTNCGIRTPYMFDETWQRLIAIWNRRPVESIVEPEGVSGT